MYRCVFFQLIYPPKVFPLLPYTKVYREKREKTFFLGFFSPIRKRGKNFKLNSLCFPLLPIPDRE